MSPPDSPLSRSSASPLASGTASPLVGAANAEHIGEHASSSNSSIASSSNSSITTTGTPATPLKARTTQQAEQPGAAALPIILLKRSKSSVQVAEENGSSSATVTFDAEPQVLPSAVALLKAAQPAPDTTADADVQLRRSQRSQTVCGEQPDAATAGYNPAQFQAITSIEDIRNILMPRRVCHTLSPHLLPFFFCTTSHAFPFATGEQSRLGEDVATPSPLATSCRLPRCERTHERRRSQHRKSLSSAEDYSKTRGSGSEGTPSRDEPAAAAGEHRHHSRHAHPQQ